MKILYCKAFGIGNAIMAIPAIKALASLGHHVEVLVGTSLDDLGAQDVMELFHKDYPYILRAVHFEHVSKFEDEFDLAILAIPCPEGRWRNGVHFKAKQVIDGRTRPDPKTTGLVSWLKSEIEYQVDNARDLGFQGISPSSQFMRVTSSIAGTYYFGVGYKKDKDGFWKVKHWGNENFIELGKLIIENEPSAVIYMTGDMIDIKESIMPIVKGIGKHNVIFTPTLRSKDGIICASNCRTYVGNDTGMMHVAAAQGREVVGLFFLENSSIKNPPFCQNSVCIERVGNKPSPKEVYEAIKGLR